MVGLPVDIGEVLPQEIEVTVIEGAIESGPKERDDVETPEVIIQDETGSREFLKTAEKLV